MKIIAAIIAILIIWVMIPHAKQGLFLAPNPLPPDSWVLGYAPSEYAQALANPSHGYGWRHFDFWENPPATGQEVSNEDFQFRY